MRLLVCKYHQLPFSIGFVVYVILCSSHSTSNGLFSTFYKSKCKESHTKKPNFATTFYELFKSDCQSNQNSAYATALCLLLSLILYLYLDIYLCILKKAKQLCMRNVYYHFKIEINESLISIHCILGILLLYYFHFNFSLFDVW